MSWSRLSQAQGQHMAAHEVLAEIYGWCTEGFDTAVPSPLPLAILFQGCAYRVLGEH
jgi:hypothetical protein